MPHESFRTIGPVDLNPVPAHAGDAADGAVA